MVSKRHADVQVDIRHGDEIIKGITAYNYLGCYVNENWDVIQEMRSWIEHSRSKRIKNDLKKKQEIAMTLTEL